MKVLVIPEDPTLDQYLLKPVVERLFEDLGRRARVEVLQDPHLSGVDQALDRTQVAEIVRDNPMIDLFLLVVDRDCDRTNNSRRVADRVAEHPDVLIGALAVEELEVWMLALHSTDLGHRWSKVRAECDPKERFADPFLAGRGWTTSVGGGRKRAMRDLGSNWGALLQKCPEVEGLRGAVEVWLQQRP